MHTIAAIDAGSNAMRMVIGQVDDAWQVHVLENLRLPIRLGGDVFSKGYIEDKTLQLAEEAFLKFGDMAEKYRVQKLRAVATSAAREAANHDTLIERIKQSSGIELELINEQEEARLVHQAVTPILDLNNQRTLLIDIGGGSVEVILSKNQTIIATHSYQLGTVRLLENSEWKHTKPKDWDRLISVFTQGMHEQIRHAIAGQPIQLCVGTGGNVEELGRLQQQVLKAESDRLLNLDELQELIKRMRALSYEERIQKWKLRPDRADVIIPAALVLYELARANGIKQVWVPKVGLKDGILQEMAKRLSVQQRLPPAEQAWQAALQLGNQYQFDEKHGQRTAALAEQLFEQSKTLHQLGPEYLLLLRLAALLHDIGYFIQAVDHEQHGFYILNTNTLAGLTANQQRLVANLVRYHRRQTSPETEEIFKSLPQPERQIICRLLALLRLADAADINHASLVNHLQLDQMKSGWRIQAIGQTDSSLVNWALEKQKTFFEEVFHARLQID